MKGVELNFFESFKYFTQELLHKYLNNSFCYFKRDLTFELFDHYWSIFCQASLKNFPVVILCIGIVFGFQNLIHLNLDGGWLGAELGSH